MEVKTLTGSAKICYAEIYNDVICYAVIFYAVICYAVICYAWVFCLSN